VEADDIECRGSVVYTIFVSSDVHSNPLKTTLTRRASPCKPRLKPCC
jgi:hypothetical protein